MLFVDIFVVEEIRKMCYFRLGDLENSISNFDKEIENTMSDNR